MQMPLGNEDGKVNGGGRAYKRGDAGEREREVRVKSAVGYA